MTRMTPDWQRLFPDEDHRFQMALRHGDAQDFWQCVDESGELLNERRCLLAQAPELYACCLPEGRAAMEEAIAEMLRWGGCGDAVPNYVEVGGMIEPDWVVLSGDAAQGHPVLGGVVVFPSSWSLPEKLGLPMSAVHEPVPGLESEIGQGMHSFLSRIAPGAAWERDNWSLSADTALNHHPAIVRQRLNSAATLETTWLRVEGQFLTRLPVSGAILFGIRISHHRLDQLAAVPGLAARMARTLETMAEAVAIYKGLHEARAPLATELGRRSADFV